MDECLEGVLAATGPADAALPLLVAVLLVGAGISAMLWHRRSGRAAGAVGGALLLALALVVAPGATTSASADAGCPPAVVAPAPLPPAVVPPVDPPVCVPSVTLEPSTAPTWVRVGSDGVVWSFTVTPDQAWLDAAAAVGATVTVEGTWTVGGYVYGYTPEGEYVDGSEFPWTATATGAVPLTLDTTGAVADAEAAFLAANPAVDPTTVGAVPTASAGEFTATATYSDGCNPASVSFPVVPGGGGGGNN